MFILNACGGSKQSSAKQLLLLLYIYIFIIICCKDVCMFLFGVFILFRLFKLFDVMVCALLLLWLVFGFVCSGICPSPIEQSSMGQHTVSFLPHLFLGRSVVFNISSFFFTVSPDSRLLLFWHWPLLLSQELWRLCLSSSNSSIHVPFYHIFYNWCSSVLSSECGTILDRFIFSTLSMNISFLPILPDLAQFITIPVQISERKQGDLY